MSDHPPTISVLMPVYNAQRYVAEAVESILNQTFGDFEFLIVDDGSRDRSLKILQHYAKRDDRIHLISRPNTGLVVALNELLSLAQGEFIARMDADDVAMPARFADQIEFLRHHPQVVCVGGAQDWIDEAGRVLSHYLAAEENSDLQRLALVGSTPINHPTAMMRRSAVLQAGGYDPSTYLAEDLDLWLKLGEIGELANLPATVIKYRQHPHSESERKQAQQQQMKQLVCERAWQRRGIAGEFTETTPWRPIDRLSLYYQQIKYGWQFFMDRRRSAAIAYGIKSIRTLPWKPEGWKLLILAVIKPFPKTGVP